ncbi:MAG TPA: type II toxin-antitoxin system RelE/ParE family toxin [Pirellulales bacterium]|nr:type II toxin-antitoxin system RelE/ParE family toxin [Pirellulales bacterium]
MRIRWLNRAEQSMRSAHNYIAVSNPQVARRMTARIRSAVEHLAEFPLSGRRGAVEGTRELVVTGVPYIVVYGSGDAEVVILRVFHAKQDRLQ